MRRRNLAAALAVLVAVSGGQSARAQVTLQGHVRDRTGGPVVGADLDFFEAQNGTKIDLSGQNDNTDAAGFYSITVSPDIYHVRVEPPLTRDELAPVQERDLILATSTTLDVVLPVGVRLSGRVTGPGAAPVAGVDLDLVDPATGTRIATVRDDTDAGGNFGFTVIPGIWHVSFAPPLGAGVGPLRVDAVDLTAAAFLDVELPRGFRVSGRVESETGTPIFGADLDARDRASRRPVPTSDDDTDFGGVFAVNLPEGSLDLFLVPPPGAPLAPTALYDVRIDTDRDIGAIVLGAGAVLTGAALDPDGLPLADADLDLFQAGTCDPFPGPTGRTDAAGAFTFRVEPGNYDVLLTPASASGLFPHRFRSVAVTSDSTLQLRLPDRAARTETVTGWLTDETGTGVEGARITGDPLGSGRSWETVTGADGTFAAEVVPGPYRVTAEPATASGLETLVLNTVDIPCEFPPSLTVTRGIALPPPSLLRSRPNPWRDATDITIALEQPAAATVLEVYDLAGRRVRTLHRGSLPGGTSVIRWNGRNQDGRPVASGLYLVRLSAGGATHSTKIARIAP